jgi:PKD repeat protein
VDSPLLSAQHIYTKPGTYLVQATVTDSAGKVAKTSATLVVSDPLPAIAVLRLHPLSKVGPNDQGPANMDDMMTWVADSSGSNLNGATTLAESIDFGDGTIVYSIPVATHTYKKAGTYAVKLGLIDATGAVCTYADGTVTQTSQTSAVSQTLVAFHGKRCDPEDMNQPSCGQ